MSDPYSLSPRDAGADHPPPPEGDAEPPTDQKPSSVPDERSSPANQDDSSTAASGSRSLLSRPFGFMRRLLGLGGDGDRREALLEELIEESQRFIGSQAHSLEYKILANIVELRDRTAYDVAVPRADIAAVSSDTSFEDLITTIHNKTHSRLPVFGENLDDILGMVHIKDVIGFIATGESFDIGRILREVLFVAPSMRVTDLLVKMQISRVHMAMVVDEFGGIDGLVTIEDLVETIVGEIEDEHDIVDESAIALEPDGTVLADARVPIELFESQFGKLLTEAEREEDIDTLGGLVFHLAGRVPSRGELLSHASGIAFEVVEADPRRIRALRVRGADQLSESTRSQADASGVPTTTFVSVEVRPPGGAAVVPLRPPLRGMDGSRSQAVPSTVPDPEDPPAGDRRARRSDAAGRRESAAAAKAAAAKSASQNKSAKRPGQSVGEIPDATHSEGVAAAGPDRSKRSPGSGTERLLPANPAASTKSAPVSKSASRKDGRKRSPGVRTASDAPGAKTNASGRTRKADPHKQAATGAEKARSGSRSAATRSARPPLVQADVQDDSDSDTGNRPLLGRSSAGS